VPRRIITILEGESLMNDATALVALRFAAAAVATGTFSLANSLVQFLSVCLGGLIVGVIIGIITVWIQKRIDDPPIEITLSLVTPFVAYLVAEALHVSGILGVVTTGLYHGWRIPEFTTSRTRLQAGPVWEMIEFLLNGLIFLLIGLQLPEVIGRLSHWRFSSLVWYAFVISAAIILIRILWVFPATWLPRLLWSSLRKRDPNPAWQHVSIVAWTGMRGVVSLAAAMALPFATATGDPFPGRDLILFLTFVVILVTLVVQGLTLPPLIRWLKVQDDGAEQQEERDARLRANHAALARLDELANSGQTSHEIIQRLRIEYEDRIRQLEACDSPEPGNGPRLFSTEYEQVSHDALQVERRTLIQLRNDRIINDEILRRVQRDIDLAEARLDRRNG
jgi:CPA1 family monovalent cation:H+ antiporter